VVCFKFSIPFSGSTVVFDLLKLDFLVVQENFGACSDWFILCLKRESESFEKKKKKQRLVLMR